MSRKKRGWEWEGSDCRATPSPKARLVLDLSGLIALTHIVMFEAHMDPPKCPVLGEGPGLWARGGWQPLGRPFLPITELSQDALGNKRCGPLGDLGPQPGTAG